jgi:hypothetical protein
MSARFAFLKDNEDGTWNAVIVGNVVNGAGEVLDALLMRPKSEIDAYVAAQLGQDHETVAPQMRH